MDTAPTSGASRALRLLTFLAWIPSFALLLPEGVSVHQLLPALGILPMTFSAATGLLHLARKAGPRSTTIVLDLFCASFLIAIFVPSCVALAETDEDVARGLVMLGALGMGGEMLNMSIHVWFVIREVNWYNTFGLVFSKGTCPNCQCEYSHAGRGSNGYIKLFGHEDDAVMKDEEQGSVCPSSTAMVFSDGRASPDTLGSR